MRIVLKMSSNEDDGTDLVVYSTSILFTMTPAHVSYSFTTFSDRFDPFGWLVGWMVGWLHYESVHFILCRHTEYEFYDYKYVASSALNANIYGNNDHKSDHS